MVLQKIQKVLMQMIVILILAVSLAQSHPTNNTFPPNMVPPFDKPPVYINETKNARLYLAGNLSGQNVPLIHLWGTPYEMGFASGTLLKEPLTQFISQMWEFMLEEVQSDLPSFLLQLPEEVQGLIAKFGLAAALDLTYLATVKFTTPSYYDELRGISDASGIDYATLRRVQLVGEATKGGCSMMGAWGEATLGGKTLQFRALDWDISGPPHNYPLVTVYHFDESQGYGHSFVNVGFMGFLGALSGMSDKRMAISEIGVGHPDASFGSLSRFGNPFTFLLRDILQFDNTIEDSIQRIHFAHRTCSLILGVGDGKEEAEMFRGFQYSASVANVIADYNLRPIDPVWHPPFKSVVYWGMSWQDRTYSGRLSVQIKKFWGQITPENIISDIIAKAQTGDTHVAVYDLTDNYMYVSFYRPDNQPDWQSLSYFRQYIKLDMAALFAEPWPQVGAD